jgi:2'-5' RNA ligase
MENQQQNPNNEPVIPEYLLVIKPDNAIVSHVSDYKDIATKLIGPYPSFNSKAHITINHYFKGNAFYFNERAPIYRSMTGRIDSFEIKINGFDHFDNQGTYTIYAKVDLNEIITARFQSFKKVFGSDVPQTPHITIARGLSRYQFKTLQRYFKNQKFESSFYADEIVVLKTPLQKFHTRSMEVETEFKLRKVI